ncbi:hypothetical protein GCM10011495_35820 [Hymenobacter frigidus]|uniref:Uncharacterized protein n=1 Tax=Hymenobacter frigidus TaxID=1524095 RepID=A0ABQ2AGS8_9BACT|nr:hypothetical protein GCM10011495_35820 [Hymenobacter frigidus]
MLGRCYTNRGIRRLLFGPWLLQPPLSNAKNRVSGRRWAGKRLTALPPTRVVQLAGSPAKQGRRGFCNGQDRLREPEHRLREVASICIPAE